MEKEYHTLEEFVKSNKRSRKGILGKVRNSWGVYDCYKLIRKNHWYDIGRPVTEKEFYAIVRGVNKYLAENIANGTTVKFPQKMGSLELRKFKAGVSLLDGHLKNTYPIDWRGTWQLWYEDKEAFENKIVLHDEQSWLYRVKYNKDKANYENKCFYQFVLNRNIKVALKENIKKRKIDALW